MKLLQLIAEKAAQHQLPFSIIGGYAVMAHGFVRATDDLDLLVKRSQRADWQHVLETIGMTVYREAPNFIQFNPASGSRLPLDLMIVADHVFARMQARAEPTKVGSVSVRVVSLIHLIALKCHAVQSAKQRNALRGVKDTDDLIQLIQINGLDLNEPELRETILKHADGDLYEKLRRACSAG